MEMMSVKTTEIDSYGKAGKAQRLTCKTPQRSAEDSKGVRQGGSSTATHIDGGGGAGAEGRGIGCRSRCPALHAGAGLARSQLGRGRDHAPRSATLGLAAIWVAITPGAPQCIAPAVTQRCGEPSGPQSSLARYRLWASTGRCWLGRSLCGVTLLGGGPAGEWCLA